MLSTETTQDVLVVRLTERRLDASKAPAFKIAIGGLIEGGAHRLVLDLRDVEFIDSSGLGSGPINPV